ncbi:uncharacterized protein LOC133886623 [Phragmites australis]|uniref:uncharacterized protein LOC133886623 n=1 Tax=Phragmites australis TaxID=29695 RepID=UPI002D775057|nr:uncharacterized protein LOC133886623 [Phragmites australis]
MWDSMIEKVRACIYRKKGIVDGGTSVFFYIVQSILLSRWGKSNTPLQCLAHSLNSRYYSPAWLNEVSGRVNPNNDVEINTERNKCFRKFFSDPDDLRKIKTQFADFSLFWVALMTLTQLRIEPILRQSNGGALIELLGQPASSSCCERNWSAYAFIHSMKRNKLTPERAEDLVFVHNNLRLLSRKSNDYQSGLSRMWDVEGDGTESFVGVGFLEGADLTLDKLEFEEEILEVED